MSIDQYEEKCRQQNDLCAICNGKSKDGILRVDHNHRTGENRDLLCDTCNLMLGHSKENPAILRAGAAYLETHAY